MELEWETKGKERRASGVLREAQALGQVRPWAGCHWGFNHENSIRLLLF